MAGLEGIRACVFDAYGTLFDVGSPVQKLATEIGDKAAGLAALWRQKQLEYTWLRSLMGVHADFWHVTGDALDFSLEALKIDDPGLRDELMTLYLKLDAYPDVAAALQAVRAKSKRTAILSNGSPSMLDSAVRAAGLEKYFDMVLSVEDVGIYKPSRRVYRHAMQKLQIQDAPVHLLCLRQQLGRAGRGAVRVSGCQAGAQRRAGRQDSGEGGGQGLSR